MKLPVTAVAALLTLLAACGFVQARPDGTAPTLPPGDAHAADHDASTTPTPSSTTWSVGSSSASHEVDVDNSSSEEENMTIQGKAAALCPPRQPELLALEAECAQDEPSDCSTTPAPAMEMTEAHVAAAVTTTEAAPHAPTTDAPAPTTDSAAKQGRRQRKRTCNYYLCVLKKLEVLDATDMPNKTLITNWITSNITDENQKEKTHQKFTECVSSLKEFFGESSENSKSTEEDTTDDKKNEETQPKKKSCVAAKKVISCLSKSVECPVLKFQQ